jgi:serine/threonine protein kinase
VNELQNFVMSMLTYDPAKRPSAAELLKHAYLQQDAAGQQQQQQQQQPTKR